jgi:hypothetical protein
MHYSQLYHTKNSDHAAILLSQGMKLDIFYRENGEAVFLFENERICKDILNDYRKGNLKIGAKELFRAMKTVQDYLLA